MQFMDQLFNFQSQLAVMQWKVLGHFCQGDTNVRWACEEYTTLITIWSHTSPPPPKRFLLYDSKQILGDKELLL